MKILHTSDWHIGKRLMDRERLFEQEQALDELVCICEKEQVELVLVAGDVFDTHLPSAEAEELFYRAVKKIAGDTRAVVVVSGNHDDGVRLSAAAPLAEEQGIYVYGNRPRTFACGGKRPVIAVESGEGYLLLENAKGEQVYLNALSYPNEARLKEEKTEETYPEKMRRWISRGESGRRAGVPYIFLSHLFVAGGKTSESEREIDLGGARAVPLHALPQDAYVALGHLHRKQKLGENVFYSGSLLQYSFDETNTEKGVFLLSTEDLLHPRFLPLQTGKKLVRLEAVGVEKGLELLGLYPDCYLELTLRLNAPLTSQETQALCEKNEGLVQIIPVINAGEHTVAVERRSKMTTEQLFTEFYKTKFGVEPSEELTTAFLSLLEEDV